VSPATARAIQDVVTTAGARFVDGGIIGPPAAKAGTTRLYLSGADAEAVADLFTGSLLEAIAIGTQPGAASALKMCYAAYTKGSTALILAVRALAEAEQVSAALVDEWNRSQQGLTQRSENAARNNAKKAWRFAGEMREIADTFAAAGLPDGFHRAAAELYETLAEFKDAQPPPELDQVVAALLGK
jgi:3-hydroxyisobutyrate dehydrogenase-like beta-hydroxyacid dehydrogenase